MKILKKTKSPEKKNIILIEKKPEKYDKTVLIIGVFHGDEPEGEALIDKFLENFPTKTKNRLLILPCLNPDGKALKTRQNINRVDLNRNFPTKNWELVREKEYFGGFEPASEIETKFLVEILDENKIDAILSLHTPYKIINYDGPAKELAEKISELTQYPVQEDIGYPTPGSFGTYAGVEREIPTITLELPENENFSKLWTKNKQVFEFFANIF